MQLYRMQDLGGCRMVLPTVQDVYKYSNSMKESKIRHILKRQNDYIESPKLSGYRSIHLVYQFQSDSSQKQVFNQYNMLIEIQFRTHLQHIWAMAVETLGLFTQKAIKSGQGDENTKRFFALVSSLFAIEEGCTVVPQTSDNRDILISELRAIDEQNHILEQLRAIRIAMYSAENDIPERKNQGYYLLRLDYNKHRVYIRYFAPSEYENANYTYDQLENKADKSMNAVLVHASSFRDVKEAYPSYFLDIADFISNVEQYF